MKKPSSRGEYEVNIVPASKLRRFDWRELFKYRDMVFFMVRRDFVAGYKQTVLGPAWAIVQPVLSTAITAFVFGTIAGLSPSGIPTYLFYMSAQVLWGFFSGALNTTTNVFLNNANLMSKVYFPRLIAPIAGIASTFISLLIQALMFAAFYVGFVVSGVDISPNLSVILLPLYILHLAILGMGAGCILSALTTKFRDLVILISYGITFWMYLSPVMYDFAIIPDRYRGLYLLNPAATIIVHARYALFDYGQTYWGYYLIDVGITAVIFLIGSRVFSRVERNFIDTI